MEGEHGKGSARTEKGMRDTVREGNWGRTRCDGSPTSKLSSQASRSDVSTGFSPINLPKKPKMWRVMGDGRMPCVPRWWVCSTNTDM